ncbi:hypothetical protein E2986_11164 [Frieseomelitta varia]|uniref:Uncharacterized protein n=1 Tax=Frieseomelitta varia TaxID=561572 RepID=A0A833RZV4_9HYME|nr:hypothetical protein E2986_11164 [Frieseomelitta varia]
MKRNGRADNLSMLGEPARTSVVVWDRASDAWSLGHCIRDDDGVTTLYQSNPMESPLSLKNFDVRSFHALEFSSPKRVKIDTNCHSRVAVLQFVRDARFALECDAASSTFRLQMENREDTLDFINVKL